jgi:hypothetical protein
VRRARLLLLLLPLVVLTACSWIDHLPTAPTTASVRLDRPAPDLGAHGVVNFYPMAVRANGS